MGIKASLTTIKTIQNKDTIKKKLTLWQRERKEKKQMGKTPE